MAIETWEIWFPDAAANGLLFSRSRVNAKDGQGRILVHAAPTKMNVLVRDEDDRVVASGRKLQRGAPGPMTYLIRDGASITLEDGWPTQEDVGRMVILPGGEAGIIKSWWNAEDHSEWRWTTEFYNHR